jgi:hypothetical protein
LVARAKAGADPAMVRSKALARKASGLICRRGADRRSRDIGPAVRLCWTGLLNVPG